jgi:hypothetical protein
MAKKPRIDKSRQQHSWDLLLLEGLHPGGCLNRHVSEYAEGNPCSHRWQAFKKALAESGKSKKYLWPAGEKGPRRGADWSVSAAGANFKRESGRPFGHESHHIVPNSELRNAIGDFGTDDPDAFIIRLLIRMGLLMEEYNLHDELNMIILPLGPRHAKVLGLPRHRETNEWHHSAYSSHVRKRLDKILAPMKPKVLDHNSDPPDYEDCKQQIEDISTDLYPKILTSKAKTLDAMFDKNKGK